jgi:GNAT superfamily N-acetyltransferase
MTKSLYAEYFEERVGGKVFENEAGFVAFKVTGEEVFLHEVYVRPEHRKLGLGSLILDRIAEVAKADGAKVMTCSISPAARGSSAAMASALAYGFKLHSTGAHEVFLAKEI